MAEKEDTRISLSQEENAQVQQILAGYHQQAERARASKDQAQVHEALADISTLSESGQMALIRELSREQHIDAADLLIALYEFSALKTVRKEARRSLIRLEGAKIHPGWQPPIESPFAASNKLQLSENAPRFWKGFVTDSRAVGELELLLTWEQGEDYKDLRVLGFLLEFWHDGAKDFFTRVEGKRSFEKFFASLNESRFEGKFKPCSLATGQRLLQEALAINTRTGTTPHRDYRLHSALINELVLQAPPSGEIDEELFLDQEGSGEMGVESLRGLKPPHVASTFVDLWTGGQYRLAYHLLAETSPLREGLAVEEWTARRAAWMEKSAAGKLQPGLLFEREAPKSKLWLPKPVKSGVASDGKEIELGWSIEMAEVPPDEKLPELPEPIVRYAETGRHWFWASYSLVQEGPEWRIQTITDEGAQARDLSLRALGEKIEQLNKEAQQRATKRKPAELQQISDEEGLLYAADVIQPLLRRANYVDALIAKSPDERSLYDEAATHMMFLGEAERCLAYLTSLLERFPEDHGTVLRYIAQMQQQLSASFLEDEDQERAEHFAELAKQALHASLALEENIEARISLAELLIAEDGHLDEAEEQLQQARKLATKPEEEANIEVFLAEIAEAREQLPQALSHYQRISEILPETAASWYDIAETQQKLGNSAEAVANYQHAIQLAPDKVDYYVALAVLYKTNQQGEQAIQVVDDGLRVNPESAELHAYRAVTYMESGDYKKAQQFMEKAERLDPESELVHVYRQIIQELSSAGPEVSE